MSSSILISTHDPATGALRNLVGASMYSELDNAEGEFVAARAGMFLERLPLQPAGSLNDLCFIHKWLFQDV